MAVTYDQFGIDFPQFVTVDEDAFDSALATAQLMASSDAWGTVADRAHGLLTAHLLALRSQAGLGGGRNTGNLTGISIPNEVSYQFSQSASFSGKGEEGFKVTIYGQEFLQLRQIKFLPFGIF